VVWLRKQLALATGHRLTNMNSPRYDSNLSERVRQFQTSHGLAADGVAGIRTLIALSELDRGPQTPVLNAPPTEGNLP
jgi:general secretion pathway protein A